MRRKSRQVARLVTLFLTGIVAGPFVIILLFAAADPRATPLMLIRWHAAEYQGAVGIPAWKSLADISPHLPRAVIASEDNLFCQHWGFDVDASRAQVEAWLNGERPRGASTITMQTAKNVFLWPDRSMLRKLLEAWLTPQIELVWSKQRILEVYLNVAEFGSGIYGAEAAAQHHFRTTASSLNINQAALLAAVLPNPREWSASNPSAYIRERARVIHRRISTLGPLLDCASP